MLTVPPMTALGAVLWSLTSLLGLGVIIAYVVWRSWLNAHHTKQAAQERRPVASVTEADDAQEIHS